MWIGYEVLVLLAHIVININPLSPEGIFRVLILNSKTIAKRVKRLVSFEKLNLDILMLRNC